MSSVIIYNATDYGFASNEMTAINKDFAIITVFCWSDVIVTAVASVAAVVSVLQLQLQQLKPLYLHQINVILLILMIRNGRFLHYTSIETNKANNNNWFNHILIPIAILFRNAILPLKVIEPQ